MRSLDDIPVYVGGARGSVDEEASATGAFIIAIGTLVSLALFLGAWGAVRTLYAVVVTLLIDAPATPKFGIAVGVLTIGLGCVLYYVREKKRAAYAILELGAGFGAAVEAWVRLTEHKLDPSALVFTLLGSVYIVVRGLDNLSKARSEKRALTKQSVWSKIH